MDVLAALRGMERSGVVDTAVVVATGTGAGASIAALSCGGGKLVAGGGCCCSDNNSSASSSSRCRFLLTPTIVDPSPGVDAVTGLEGGFSGDARVAVLDSWDGGSVAARRSTGRVGGGGTVGGFGAGASDSSASAKRSSSSSSSSSAAAAVTMPASSPPPCSGSSGAGAPFSSVFPLCVALPDSIFFA